MIVVDTNIVAHLLITGDKTDLAQALYRKDNHWLLPTLWRHEFLNVVSSFVRFGGGTQADGIQLWERGLRFFSNQESDADLDLALRLSLAHGISAYDAQFVALAQQNRIQLVTEDSKVLAAFPDTATRMQDYLNQPP